MDTSHPPFVIDLRPAGDPPSSKPIPYPLRGSSASDRVDWPSRRVERISDVLDVRRLPTAPPSLRVHAHTFWYARAVALRTARSSPVGDPNGGRDGHPFPLIGLAEWVLLPPAGMSAALVRELDNRCHPTSSWPARTTRTIRCHLIERPRNYCLIGRLMLLSTALRANARDAVGRSPRRTSAPVTHGPSYTHNTGRIAGAQLLTEPARPP